MFKKFLGMVLSVGAIAACTNKELPQGTRHPLFEPKFEQTNIVTHQKATQIPTAVYNYQWAQTGINGAHLGNNLAAPTNLKKVWTADFGDGSSEADILLATPIIIGQMVIAEDSNATVSAFNLADGSRIWRQKLKPQNANEKKSTLKSAGLAASGNTIFAATGYGVIYALKADTGEILWQYSVQTPVRSAPTVCGQTLYVLTVDNKILALNTADGSLSWQYNISAEDTLWAGSAAPACSAEKNMLVTGFSNGEVQAFNAGIGFPLWTLSLINTDTADFKTEINALKAAPVIDESYVFATGNELTAAADARTGDRVWAQNIGGSNMPWVVGPYVYITSADNKLYALNKKNGQILWSVDLAALDEDFDEDSRFFAPIMLSSKILAANSNGNVYAFSAEDGALLYQMSLNKDLAAAPIFANGYLIFMTDNAKLVAYQ